MISAAQRHFESWAQLEAIGGCQSEHADEQCDLQREQAAIERREDRLDRRTHDQQVVDYARHDQRCHDNGAKLRKAIRQPAQNLDRFVCRCSPMHRQHDEGKKRPNPCSRRQQMGDVRRQVHIALSPFTHCTVSGPSHRCECQSAQGGRADQPVHDTQLRHGETNACSKSQQTNRPGNAHSRLRNDHLEGVAVQLSIAVSAGHGLGEYSHGSNR